MNVQTLAGTPVNNVTISPTTTCLNQLQITQLVSQYCVGCTVIVIPPPSVVYVTTEAPAVTTTAPPQQVIAYCMSEPVLRADGTVGNLIYLPVGTAMSQYATALPATYVPGTGETCPQGTVASDHVPLFTLTVPASFVGQFIQLCLQPSGSSTRVACHSIQIDTGATISIPVTANVVARVVKKAIPARDKSKSPKQLAKASKAFLATGHVISKPVVRKTLVRKTLVRKTLVRKTVKKGGHAAPPQVSIDTTRKVALK